MKKMGRVLLAGLVCQFQIFSSVPAWALPQGEQVIAGNAQFERPNDATLNITTGDKTIIEYNSFNIAQPESVNFFQPSSSSIALNRVTGGDPSSILGRLSATGKIFLINPNGILFGVGSQVDTAGFVASVLDIANDDFLSGNYKFEMKPGSENAAVINHGLIKVASGGFAGLVGPQVENHGLVIADQGKIALASGEKVTLDFDGDGLINFVLEGELENALVSNTGTLQARGGEVLLSARAAESVINSVVNNEGLIDASGVEMDGGVIRLIGEGGGVTANSGTLNASSEQSGGGTVQVLGDKVGLFDGEVNASGATGGGEVLIGGDYQGKNADIRNASRTYMSETARIYADAVGAGHGGRVILWSDLGTQVYGHIYARGGAQGGNGGFIETSGAQWLDVTVPPDVSAALGIGGEWLLDPNNLEIVAGNGNTNINNNTPFVTTDDTAQLGVDLIIAALGGGDVTISTGTGGGNSQIGNLTWTADMNFNTIGVDRTLILNAHNNITINGSISQSGTPDDFLSIIFNADSDSNGGGAIVINNSITTGGGYLLFRDSVYLAANLDTSTALEGFNGGEITFEGDVLLARNGGITLTTNGLAAGFGGAINFQGTLDSGNSYSLVNETHTWTNAVADAESGDGDGVGDTYLATVTSGVESAIVTTTANNNQVWLGGSDSAVEGEWRWVTGPEGLEESGAGRQFWQGAEDGTAFNGAYENWTPDDEPNDFGGNEDALQGGFGALGLWNDLPVTSELDYYVLETNLADTALTINADTGAVTFGGVVGANKTLGALNINSAGAVNINAAMNTSGNITVANSGVLTTTAAGDITTSGAFTQNGTGTAALAGDITAGGNINLNRPTSMTTDLTLYAGDNVNVVNNITRTAGGTATLRLRANNGVIFSSGADITASNGSLNVIMNSDRDANEIGNINLGSGTVITSNGGEIILSGGNGDDDYLRNTGYAWGTSFGATQNRGVYLTNAQLLSGAGNITVRGHGDDLNGNVNQGVDIVVGSIIESSSGNITINGVAGNGSAQNDQKGVVVYLGSRVSTTTSGNISITGTANNSGTGTEQAGVQIVENAIVRADGAGSITITGTGGTSGSGLINPGVWLTANSRIEGGSTGAINIHGTPGAGNSGILFSSNSTIGEGALEGTYSGDITLSSDKIDLLGGANSVSGTGSLLLQPATPSTTIGIGGGAGTLSIDDTDLAALANGFSEITIGRSNGTGDIEVDSISMFDSLTIRSPAGDGDITVRGNILNVGFNTLTLQAGNSIVTADGPRISSTGAAFDIIFNADRDGSGAGAINLNIGTEINSADGEIILSGGTGTTEDLRSTGYAYGTTDDGTMNRGIYLRGGQILSGAGNITIRGIGANTDRELNQGVDLFDDSIVQSSSGNITINGVAGNGSAQNNQKGISIYDGVRVSTTSSGNINMTGTASNDGTGEEQIGILVAENSIVRADNTGSITLTGTGGSNGSTRNFGLWVADNSSIEGGNNGAIMLNGIAGNNSTGINFHFTAAVGEGDLESAYSGDITFSADSMGLGGASFQTTGTATLLTRTAGRLIDLGSTLDTTANTLELSGAEIQQFTVGNLVIGDGTNGNITVHGISAANSNNVSGTVTLNATRDNARVIFNSSDSTFNTLTVNADDGIDIDVSVTTDTGALILDGDADDSADTNDNIDLAGGVTLTSAGALNLTATNGLLLSGGDGTTTTLDANGDTLLTLPAIIDTNNVNLTVNSEGGITLAALTNLGSGTYTFNADNDDDGTETLTVNGTITGSSALTLRGGMGTNDTVDVNADITARGLTIRNAATIDLAAGVDIATASDGISMVTSVGTILLSGADATTNTITSSGDVSVNLADITDTNNPNLTVTSEGSLTLAGGTNLGTGTFTFTADNDNDSTASLNINGAFTGGTAGLSFSGGGTGTNDTLNLNSLINAAYLFTQNFSAISLGANITTFTSQTYSGPLTLTADSILTGAGISFASTINGAHALTIDAGATDVAFPAGVGTTTPLTGLTIDAANWTLNGAGAFIAGNVDIDTTNNINFNFGLTTTAGGTVTLSAGGTLFIADGAAFDLDGAFLQDNGAVRLLDNITTTNDNLEFQGAVTLEDDAVLSTGAGAGGITLGSTINGAHTLGLNAGTGAITASGNIGAATALTGLTVTQSDTAAFNGTLAAGTVTLTDTAETISFAGLVTIGTALVTAAQDYRVRFLAGGTVAGDTTFLNTGGVTLGNDSSDSITFSGGLDTRAGSTSIRGTVLTSNANMDFGRVSLSGDAVINSGAGAGDIHFHGDISGFDDLQVNAGTGDVTFDGEVGSGLVIGALTVSGNDVTLNASVMTTDNVTITNDGTFTTAAAGDIDAGGAFTNDGGGTAVLEGDIRSEGTITLDNAITIPGDLTVRARGGSSDVLVQQAVMKSSGENADVSFTAERDLTISNAITNTDDSALNLELSAGRHILLTGAAADISNNGTYTVTADSDEDGTGTYTQDNAGSAVITGNGAVSITAADIDLTGTLNSGTAATTLLVSQAGRTMGLGATAGGFTLSGSELQNITAAGLNFGGSANGDITVDGITAANSNNISGTLTLNATRDDALVYFSNTASTFNALTANADDGIDVRVNVTTDTGALILDADADNASDNNDYIHLAEGVTLTSAGAMTLNATTNGIYLSGAEGTTVTLDANGDSLLTLGALDTGDANLTANSEGGITLAGAGLGAGTHVFTADNDNDGTAVLTLNGTVTGSSVLTFSGGGTGTNDTLDINADVTANLITIQNFNLVDLADNVDLTASNGALMASSNVGSINLSGADGTTNILDGNGDALVSLAALTDTNNANLTVNSEGSLTLSTVTLGTGTHSFTADNDDDGTSTLTINGVVQAGDLTLSGGGAGTNDTLDINADVTAATNLTIHNASVVDLAEGVDLSANNGDLTAYSNVGSLNFSGADATTNTISGAGGVFFRLARLSDTNNVDVTVSSDYGIILNGADNLGTGNYRFLANTDNSGDSLTLNGTITGNAVLTFSAGGTGSSSGINLNNHVTGSSIMIESADLASLGGDLRTDGGAITNTAAASRLTASITIDTEQGGDGAAGAVNFAATSLMSDGTVDRDLTINTSTAAAGQNGGAVSLGVFNANEGYINDVSIDTSAGAGGTAGSLTLHGNIELDDDFFGNSSSFTVTGDGDIIISNSLTIDTEANNRDGVAGGNINFGLSNLYADAAGYTLTLDTTNTNAGESAGSVTLGLVDDNAGSNHFLNSLIIHAASDTNGNINLGNDVTVNGGNLTLNGAVLLGRTLELNARTGTVGLGSASTLAALGYDLTVTADEINFNNAANTITPGANSDLLLQPYTASLAMALGGAGSTAALDLTAAEIASLADGFQSITIGRSDSSGDVTVGAVTFLDPTTIRTPGGAILDDTSDNTVDITAPALTLTAGTGIGQTNGSLDIEVDTLTSAASATGGIALNLLDADNGGVTVTSVDASTSGDIALSGTTGTALRIYASVDANNGGIEITSAGPVMLTNVQSDTGVAGTHDISVTTSSGSITAGSVVSDDEVTLQSAGAINGVTNDNTADVSGTTINLTASSGGIGTTTPLDFTATTAVNADTTADNANISLDSIGNALIGLVTTGSTSAGTILFRSTGAINSVTNNNVADFLARTITLIASLGGIGAISAVDFTAGGATINADTTADNSDILLDSIGDAVVGLIDAGTGDVTLNSTGAIDSASDDDTADISGATITMTAQSVGTGTTLDVAATTALFTDTSSVNGSIVIDGIGDMLIGFVDAGSGNITMTTAGKMDDHAVDSILDFRGTQVILNATQGVGNIRELELLVQNGNASTPGDYTATNTTATGTIDVEAGGDILDDPDSGTTDFTSGGDTTLVSGGIIGTKENPIEVDVRGQLFIAAGSKRGIISAMINGKTSDGQIHLLEDSEGLVIFNNRIVGGQDSVKYNNQIGAASGPQIRGVDGILIINDVVVEPSTAPIKIDTGEGSRDIGVGGDSTGSGAPGSNQGPGDTFSNDELNALLGQLQTYLAR